MILPSRLCFCFRLLANAVQLSHGQPVSCCAISCSYSVAPHSNWQFFDSAVLARYICHLPAFLSSWFLCFPDLDLCLTASSPFLSSYNNESSLSCCVLLKPGSSFLQSSSRKFYSESKTVIPMGKSCSTCNSFYLGLKTSILDLRS